MSGIFKKIKSAFVIEEGKSSESAEDSRPQEKASGNEEDPKTPIQDIAGATEPGTVNPKFMDILLKALEANNQEGFDYIEFKRSLQNLLKLNMDEMTVYKSAYATAQTLGATPQALISSAQQYLVVLKKEDEKFKVALNNQRSRQIDGGLQEIAKYEESIKQKVQHIEKLKEEISQIEEKLTGRKSEIEDSAQKIEVTRSDFVASYTSLVNQIRQDIENIGKYLN
jgi:hypothetical protein